MQVYVAASMCKGYRSVYMYVLREYKVQLARKYLVTILIRPMCHGNLR
jgi:hypothetical protein